MMMTIIAITGNVLLKGFKDFEVLHFFFQAFQLLLFVF